MIHMSYVFRSNLSGSRRSPPRNRIASLRIIHLQNKAWVGTRQTDHRNIKYTPSSSHQRRPKAILGFSSHSRTACSFSSASFIRWPRKKNSKTWPFWPSSTHLSVLFQHRLCSIQVSRNYLRRFNILNLALFSCPPRMLAHWPTLEIYRIILNETDPSLVLYK